MILSAKPLLFNGLHGASDQFINSIASVGVHVDETHFLGLHAVGVSRL